ncbi:MAG: hypothetical protein E7439_00710 [Ruminococcaceae bacterium]|nr:hypothetical protein [Oscillospiraceae bacterium]
MPDKKVSLPWRQEDLGVEIEELVAYEGPFLEDGSYEPVSDAAAIMLRNTGSRGISFCMVAVEMESRTLYFAVTWLPAGERALVLEHDGQVYTREAIAECRVVGIRWEEFESAPLQVTQLGEKELTVTNQSGQTLENSCLRHKLYVSQGDYYLGGFSFCTYLPILQPGESCRIRPENYGAETAKIVAKLKK